MSYLDKKKISKQLDIGSSFLFLDKAKIFEKKSSALGKLKIRNSHWSFSSHLIKQPMFPGVFLVEALCQTAMLIIYKKFTQNLKSKGFLRNVNVTFRNVISKKNTPLEIKTFAKKISSVRGVSIYFVKATSLNGKTTFADGEIIHFVPLEIKKNKSYFS